MLERVRATSSFNGAARRIPLLVLVLLGTAAAMDSVHTIPDELWEGLDYVSERPLFFWLALGTLGLVGAVAVV